MRKMLSFGNHKLPTSTGIFNLPAGRTCPGATAKCAKWCYAKKAERQYPAVLPFRMKNWDATKELDFKDKILAELSHKKKVDTIRIHESGDLYCQAYLDKWIEIAKALPLIRFYAYTKHRALDFSLRPDNFIVLLSDDDNVYQSEWHRFDGVTTVTPRGAPAAKGWLVCPGNCRTCDVCWNTTKNKRVTFLEH